MIYEELAAVFGVSVAMSALLITHYTGSLFFDLVGETVVGCILLVIARQIYKRNSELLNHP